MTSEATITEELIHKAADYLHGLGRRPTNDGLREVLAEWTKTKGGSYATISPALRSWKERQRASAEPIREAAPQPLVDRGGALISELWAGALELAMARLTSERDALTAARKDLEAETAEALALAERREDERDVVKQALSSQIEQLTSQLDAARADASAKAERSASQEARADELSRELAAVRSDLSAERARRDEAEAARRSVEVQLSSVAAENARLVQQVADLTSRNQNADTELARTRGEHKTEMDRLMAAHKEALQEQRHRSAETIDRITKTIQRLEADVREHVATAKSAAERAGKMEGELEILRTTTANQAEMIRQLTGKGGGVAGGHAG